MYNLILALTQKTLIQTIMNLVALKTKFETIKLQKGTEKLLAT